MVEIYTQKNKHTKKIYIWKKYIYEKDIHTKKHIQGTYT